MTVFYRHSDHEQLRSLIVRDLSVRHRYQEALIEQERLRTALEKETELSQIKSRMMERIAHEFRTPLAIIGASAESLNVYLDRLTPEQRDAKVKKIQTQIQHFSVLLDQIGLAMRGTLVPDDLQITTIDLSHLCRQTVHELEAQLVQPGKYDLHLPETALIQADPAVLKNALVHVLHNAARFSAANAPITVSLTTDEQGVEVTVRDSGIGILPQEQGRIFEAFFRGSNIGVISGLGLGLTIAQGCVELHHGTIKMESAPGEGTTVRIWLPRRANKNEAS